MKRLEEAQALPQLNGVKLLDVPFLVSLYSKFPDICLIPHIRMGKHMISAEVKKRREDAAKKRAEDVEN